MRVTIPHNRPKQEMKDSVERSIDQLFTGFSIGVIEFIDQRKQWSGDTMTFSLSAKLGFLRTPIRGSALVTDREVILDVDLGLLSTLIAETSAATQIVGRAKALLNK
jgi:Putative polyhydroxyalkanoic acid system protein (PHA_gran_rgn)